MDKIKSIKTICVLCKGRVDEDRVYTWAELFHHVVWTHSGLYGYDNQMPKKIKVKVIDEEK